MALGALRLSVHGILWEEFISRPTTVIELDLQLCFAVNISRLAQWQSYLILDMLKAVFLKSTSPSLLRRGLKFQVFNIIIIMALSLLPCYQYIYRRKLRF